MQVRLRAVWEHSLLRKREEKLATLVAAKALAKEAAAAPDVKDTACATAMHADPLAQSARAGESSQPRGANSTGHRARNWLGEVEVAPSAGSG